MCIDIVLVRCFIGPLAGGKVASSLSTTLTIELCMKSKP